MNETEFGNRYRTDRKSSGLLNRIEQNYSTDELFVLSLAELFGEKPLKYWNSSCQSIFEVNVHQTIRWIEDLAEEIDLDLWKLGRAAASKKAGMWVENRVKLQFARVVHRLGKNEAKKFMERLIQSVGDSP
jgi:hypothetical protein